MRWPQIWRLRLRALLRGRAVDRDLTDELQGHLDDLIDENIAAGLSPRDARDKALREFGGVVRLTEESREARGLSWLTNAVQDFRYGMRLLRRTPGFTAAAVLTLALGIGATTAMFSIVYGVVLRPLPFGEPDRLVALWTHAPALGLPRALVGAANARDWRAQNQVFEDIALVRPLGNYNLVGQGEPERLQTALISANVLSVLGVSPMLGRGFLEEEDEIGGDTVVILSHDLWKTRFGADPGVIGRQISLNASPKTIVGVMGPDFSYPSRDFQIWLPLTINPRDYVTRSGNTFLSVARLKPGTSLELARAEMDVVARRLEQQYPDKNTGSGVLVEPLLASTVVAVRRPLFVLLAAVAAMLLIGCANLANLLLTRALARRRELAVRTALGAARARLVAQSITELAPTLVLGGALGLLLARWILDLLMPLMPSDMPRVEGIAIHVPVLLVSLGLLAAVGAVIGAWPALEIARRDQRTPIAELSRAPTASPVRARAGDALVVAQVAMTLLLLITATLLMRSFAAVKEIDPGFTSERVLSIHLKIPRSKYRSDTAVADLCRRVLERVAQFPGVESAGMVNRLPLAGGVSTDPPALDRANPAASVASSDLRSASSDYFRTMGIPLKDGRTFTDADIERGPLVAVIDERLARAAWPGENPIGQRFRAPDVGLFAPFDGSPWATVVGVVGHVRHDSLETDSRPQVYWNYLQRPMDGMALVVKTHGEPDPLTQSIGSVIRSIDPEQPIYDVRTLDAVVDRSLGRRWLQTTLLGVFAGLALLLATIGVYGVIAYAVGQRAREFGIRLALGASRRDVVRMVVGRGARLTLIGAAIGLVAALAASRALASLLFNVPPLDVFSFAAATGMLVTVAVLACYVPARRAGRIDPTHALRTE